MSIDAARYLDRLKGHYREVVADEIQGVPPEETCARLCISDAKRTHLHYIARGRIATWAESGDMGDASSESSPTKDRMPKPEKDPNRGLHDVPLDELLGGAPPKKRVQKPPPQPPPEPAPTQPELDLAPETVEAKPVKKAGYNGLLYPLVQAKLNIAEAQKTLSDPVQIQQSKRLLAITELAISLGAIAIGLPKEAQSYLDNFFKRIGD